MTDITYIVRFSQPDRQILSGPDVRRNKCERRGLVATGQARRSDG